MLDPETVASTRAAFAIDAIRSACTGREWEGLRTAVAGAGFTGTRLPPAPTR